MFGPTPHRWLPLVALLAVWFGSCATPPAWRRLETGAPFEDVWNSLVRVAAQNGYREHPDTDRGHRSFVSQWRTNQGPFRTSKRTRLLARCEPAVEPVGWMVEFHVERQRVETIGKSFEVAESDWSRDGQELHKEQVIFRQLLLALDAAAAGADGAPPAARTDEFLRR